MINKNDELKWLFFVYKRMESLFMSITLKCHIRLILKWSILDKKKKLTYAILLKLCGVLLFEY